MCLKNITARTATVPETAELDGCPSYIILKPLLLVQVVYM